MCMLGSYNRRHELRDADIFPVTVLRRTFGEGDSQLTSSTSGFATGNGLGGAIASGRLSLELYRVVIAQAQLPLLFWLSKHGMFPQRSDYPKHETEQPMRNQ